MSAQLLFAIIAVACAFFAGVFTAVLFKAQLVEASPIHFGMLLASLAFAVSNLWAINTLSKTAE